MALSRSTALTEVARDATSRANLVAIGLLLVTLGVIVSAIFTVSVSRGATPTQAASISFTARVLVAVGALFLGLAFLVPAVSDADLGTALRIALLVAGLVVLIVLIVLR